MPRLVDRLRERARRSPGGVWTTSRLPLGSSESAQRRSAERELAAGGRGRPRRAARRRGGPSSSRTLTSPSCGDVARDRRLHGVVARLAQRVGELRLRRELAALRRGAGSRPGDRTSSSCEHLLEDRERVVDLFSVTSAAASGAARSRRRCRRAARARAHASTTSPRRPVELDAEEQARGRAPRRRRGSARAARRARAPLARQFASSSSVERRRTTAHAAAHATGLPPNVLAVVAGLEAAGRLVGDEQRADRQAVREALRERDGVRLDAELLARRRTCRSARRRSGSRRSTSSAPCSSASARAAARNSGVERDARRPRPGSARAGCSRVVVDGRGRERADVVELRERDAGHERLERARASPAGRSTASAPSVRPWNEPSSATTPGLAGRLARVLDRRLDRLGAGVAEERLRAAEALARAARRAAPSAPSSRGSRRARACRAARARRRAAPDGGARAPTTAIPPTRVEVARCPRRPSSQAAVAARRSDVRARVGREQRRRCVGGRSWRPPPSRRSRRGRRAARP